MRKAALLALALLLALPAAAQHEHHGEDLQTQPAAVLIDVAIQDVIVGQPVTFTVLLADGDGAPLPHQDMRIRATFEGIVLLDVPAATGHDYDGYNEVTLTFPSLGRFKVELLDARGRELASNSGWVVDHAHDEAVAHLVGPATAATGVPGEYRMWPADRNGTYVTHFYTLFQAWDEDGLALQAKLHGHSGDEINESIAQLAFPHPGSWLLRAHMFQAATNGAHRFAYAPLVAELAVEVVGDAPPGPASAAGLSWTVANGTERPLVATIDPQPELGLHTPARITTRARGEDGGMRTHVDFHGTLRDGAGRILFDTPRLHESDGLMQVLVRPGVAGDYVWSTVADVNGTRIDMPFRVVPGDIQPAMVKADLPSFVAGVPAAISLGLQDGAGRPLPHSEIGLEVLAPDGGLRQGAKLHTHDGTFRFTLTMLDAGAHTMRLVPHGLGQDDVQAEVLELAVDVAPGAAWPVEHKPPPEPLGGPGGGTSTGDLMPPLAWRAAAAVLLVGFALAGSAYAWRRMR